MLRPGGRRLITIATAAAYADVSAITIRRWVAAGLLPAYRVGPRLLKIDQDELDGIVRRVPTTQGP